MVALERNRLGDIDFYIDIARAGIIDTESYSTKIIGKEVEHDIVGIVASEIDRRGHAYALLANECANNIVFVLRNEIIDTELANDRHRILAIKRIDLPIGSLTHDRNNDHKRLIDIVITNEFDDGLVVANRQRLADRE